MRTLKKTLALVLVLAMMFSLCVTASAYTDDADIEYTEAVELLSALEVIEGYPDGSFGADKQLNRAEAAAIIARLNGYFDLAAATPTYTDMAGYGWANAAVAYCENEGIVNGTAEGIYEPGTTLTGYMFVKMLAVSMGVDADEAGMTGAAWQIGVTKVNKEFGITAGIEDMDLAAPITREQAAQCAFNALLYARDGYTWAVDHGNHTHYFKTEEEAILFAAADIVNCGLPYTGDYDCSLGYEVFGLYWAEDVDDWGHPVYGYWSDYANYGYGDWYTMHYYAPVASFTAHYTEGDVFAKTSDSYKVKEDKTMQNADYVSVNTIFVNGKEAETGADYYKGGKGIESLSGNGTEVYFYKTLTMGNIQVVIEEFIGEVTDVIKANPATGTDRVIELTTYCGGNATNDPHDFNNTFLAFCDQYNKKDILLFNQCYNEYYGEYVTYVVGAPETVSGSVVKEVQAPGKDTIYTIGEADFVLSAHNDCIVDDGMTATWYLDSHGNLMMKGADAKLTYKYGYLLAYDAQNAYAGDKTHEETFEASETYVIYDAEQGIIELNGAVAVKDYNYDGVLETWLPGAKQSVANTSAYAADDFDIAYLSGKYNKDNDAGLSTGLVLYLVDENNDIYWISDEATLEGVITIIEAPHIEMYKNNVHINGGAKRTGVNTQFFYAGATVQSVFSTAIGYTNCIKGLDMPGEVLFNTLTNEVIAVSQHVDLDTNTYGLLYVGNNFGGTMERVTYFDKELANPDWVTYYTVTYTGLSLNDQALATHSVTSYNIDAAEYLMNTVSKDNLYFLTVNAYGQWTVGEQVAEIDSKIAEISAGDYIAAGDYYFLDKEVTYVEVVGHMYTTAAEGVEVGDVIYAALDTDANGKYDIIYFYSVEE